MFPLFESHLNSIQKRLLSQLSSKQAVTRQELREDFTVSAQTVMRAVLPLVHAGLIRETPVREGIRGHPVYEISLIPDRLLVVGIGLSEFELSASLEDLDGRTLKREIQTGDFSRPSKALFVVEEMLERLVEAVPQDAKCLYAGVSAQGHTVVLGRQFAARGDIEAWSDIDLKSWAERRTALPVVVRNDAKALAMWLSHAHPDISANTFVIHISSGIGGAAICDGQYVEGHSGNAATFGALIPDGPYRPTNDQFLKAFGRNNWTEFAASELDHCQEWLRTAASKMSAGLSIVNALYDPEEFCFISPIPDVIMSEFIRNLEIKPSAHDLTAKGLAKDYLFWPRVRHHVGAPLDKAACTIAVTCALSE